MKIQLHNLKGKFELNNVVSENVPAGNLRVLINYKLIWCTCTIGFTGSNKVARTCPLTPPLLINGRFIWLHCR